MEAWLLQPNVAGGNLEEGTGRKGQNSDSEESSSSEEESCDEEDEINMRYYGKWPTDLSVNQALSALQLTVPEAEEAINQSTLAADQPLDAIADRCADPSKEDVVLAMINTYERQLLTAEQAA